MTAVDERREVLRYFVLVVAVAALAAVVVLVLIHQRYRYEIAARDSIESYHLRTAMLAREVTARLSDLRPPDPEAPYRASTALFSIAQTLDSIEELHRQFADQTFAGTVARARAAYERIRESFERPENLAGLDEQIEVLALTMFQLDRLHAGAVELALDEMAGGVARRTRNLTLIVAAVLALSAVLMWRLLALMRARMLQHAEAREALLAKDRQLIQMQKVEALGTLVGGVAHDFNNLLTVILGTAEALLSDLPQSDPRRAELAEVQKAGERAAALTRQLLVFSRQDMAEAQAVDLNLLLRDVEPLLRRLIPADIDLTVEAGERQCLVEVNYVQMEQVLINLAANAADAMPEGGSLSIHCSQVRVEPGSKEARLPPGGYARIRVRDTGHGMQPEVRERAFDPFYTTKEEGKGTGLGLSTVHGIVTKSGGQILVQSESGSGSTFDVYLPCGSGVAERTAADGTDVETGRGTETVLLVEDQDQVRELTAAGLRSAGYRVIEAANGAEALGICESREIEIDLILSDVVMPEMRGPELVARARTILPGVGVVFTSGYSDKDVLTAVRESGHPLVAKPFKMHLLLEVLRRELDAVARPGEESADGATP